MTTVRVLAIAASIALAGCTQATERTENTWPIGPTEWSERTAALLERAIGQAQVEGDQLAIQLPSYEANDVYTMALVLVGLGKESAPLLESINFDVDRERFDRGLSREQLMRQPVPVTFVGRELARADAAVPNLLSADQEQTLSWIVDEAVADSDHDWDLVETWHVVDIGRATGYRHPELAAWAVDVTADIELGCQQMDDLFGLSFAADLGVDERCGDEELAILWDEAADYLLRRLEGSSTPAGIDDCGLLSALNQLRRNVWPESQGRLRTVEEILSGVVQRLAHPSLVEDPTLCLRDIRAVADDVQFELSVPPNIKAVFLDVLIGGGSPGTVRLDPLDLVRLARTARMVGADLRLPLGALPEGGDALALELREPGNSEETVEFRRAVDSLAAGMAVDDLPAATALARALVEGGEEACSPRAVTMVRSVLAQVEDKLHFPDLRLELPALASGGLRTCGFPEPGVEEAIIERARAVMEARASDTPPPVMQAADAVVALCVLQPRLLPEPSSLWEEYVDDAALIGGSPSGHGSISIHKTYALATIAQTSADECAPARASD